MASRYKFSEEEIKTIEQRRKGNKNKRTEARLKALELRAKGANAKEVAEATGFHAAYVTQLVAKYRKYGLEAMSGNHYGGNHRNNECRRRSGYSCPLQGASRSWRAGGNQWDSKSISKCCRSSNQQRTDLFCAAPTWMAQSNAPEQTPQEGQRGRNCGLKKINTTVQDLKVIHSGKTIRLMFQDEAGFGRINKPKYCWCEKGIRPSVPCHHIREYRYAYGAVEPLTGEGYFLIMPYCNTACMNIFLKQLSEQYPDDVILLCCDSAAWHKSSGLILPNNIVLFHIPPYTPEMNPIEQIWKEIRKRGFHNEVFATLDKVVQRLCDTICSLTNQAISSITGRNWIIKSFN